MEMKLIQKSKDDMVATLLCKGVLPTQLNTLRRLMIDYVPTIAMENIEIVKNSSVLYDEVVAHRLGLVVLKTTDDYVMPTECTCKGEGCAKCQVKLTLKAKGPCTVYASEMKSSDPKVKPVYGKTPIVKLLVDQEIEVVASAQLGIGKEHTKWSPGLVFYRQKPIIDSKDVKKVEDLAKSNPNILKKLDIELDKTSLLEYQLTDSGIETLKEQGVKIGFSETDYLFRIESWGALSALDISQKSIEILNKQLDTFAVEVKKL